MYKYNLVAHGRGTTVSADPRETVSIISSRPFYSNTGWPSFSPHTNVFFFSIINVIYNGTKRLTPRLFLVNMGSCNSRAPSVVYDNKHKKNSTIFTRVKTACFEKRPMLCEMFSNVSPVSTGVSRHGDLWTRIEQAVGRQRRIESSSLQGLFQCLV